MSQVLITESILTDIADAIREKVDSTSLIPVRIMADAIRCMSYPGDLLEEYLESTITSYTDEEIKSIKDYTFYGCTALTLISLPVATSLGEYAFNGCTALTSVNLPLATSISGYAFCDCTSLTSISLPSATSISYGAFSGCTALTEIHFAAANQSTIEANSYYSSKWGADNATIYFDL